jgi:histidine kinase
MSAMHTRPADYRSLLFEEIPCGIVIVDRSLHVVDHNRAFADVFGDAHGKACFLATRGRSQPCPGCPAQLTFADHQTRALEQTGTDKNGRPAFYLVQITPIHDADGNVPLVAAITTDLTASKRLQREYQTLFEKVPCYVTVINRDFRVVKANEMFRRVFGEGAGEPCHKLYKHRPQRCETCPAESTFGDGLPHTAQQVGVTREGEQAHYVVSTAPLLHADGEVTHVIEMALDVTETHALAAELSHANALREVLVEHAPYAIVVLDKAKRVALLNRAAEELWGFPRGGLKGKRLPRGAMTARLEHLLPSKAGERQLHETTIHTARGEEVPVRVAAFRLPFEDATGAIALIVQDLREVRQLEREKLDAERLAAVGQTVAGLAHGIKNILTGLEGGMYVTSTGLQRNDDRRVRQGWEMLERNIGRISVLVKSLLAFSRGDRPTLGEVDPVAVAREVVELYRASADQHGVRLMLEPAGDVAPAWMDAEGLHTCIANLISNALDACLLSNRGEARVTARVADVNNAVVVEVGDNGCGMDYEVKQKVFTSFFTTKGAGGSGLGLLVTRKIVQQHGGSVTFESTPGEGTIFRLTFPRDRLPRPDADADEEAQ